LPPLGLKNAVATADSTAGRQEAEKVAGQSTARWRIRGGAVVGILLVGAAVFVVGGRPQASGAAMLHDSDSAAASRAGDQIAALDAGIRSFQAQLPVVQAAVAAASAALANGVATDARIQAGGLPPTPVSVGTTVDTATNAILGDLAPEHTTAVITRSTDALSTGTVRRDALQNALDAASTQRAAALDDLERSGQVQTLWSIRLLDRLGAPVTTENLHALSAWVGAEANDVTLHNPLATTMGAPGARSVNDAGVKGYPSDDVGLDATVATLRNGLYGAITDALQRGDSALSVVTAVAASKWGTGMNAVARYWSDRR
jgi:hypothetical protein